MVRPLRHCGVAHSADGLAVIGSAIRATSAVPAARSTRRLCSPPTGTQVGPGQPRQVHYVNGRVVMDTGQPVTEPVSVELNCGTRSLQVVHTDLRGYFRFTL